MPRDAVAAWVVVVVASASGSSAAAAVRIGVQLVPPSANPQQNVMVIDEGIDLSVSRPAGAGVGSYTETCVDDRRTGQRRRLDAGGRRRRRVRRAQADVPRGARAAGRQLPPHAGDQRASRSARQRSRSSRRAGTRWCGPTRRRARSSLSEITQFMDADRQRVQQLRLSRHRDLQHRGAREPERAPGAGRAAARRRRGRS